MLPSACALCRLWTLLYDLLCREVVAPTVVDVVAVVEADLTVYGGASGGSTNVVL